MQTVTYRLILNLAITDLFCSLICIPPEIPMFLNGGQWIYGAPFCKILYPLQTLSVYGVIFTLVSVSLIRCWSVMCPLKTQPNEQNIYWFIVPIWSLSIACIIPYVIVLNYSEKDASCLESWSHAHSQAYTLFIFATQIVIPLAIVPLAYGLTVTKLRTTLKTIKSSSQKRREKETAMITNMAIATTVNFAVCLLPHHVISFWYHFGNLSDYENFADINSMVYLFLFSHSAINPILYNVFNKTFRNSLKKLITSSFKCSGVFV